MKIGIFTDAYYPVTSGVVTSIRMVEQEMKKRGHEVYVFAPTKSEPTDNQNLYMLKSMPLLVAKEYKNRIATFYSRTISKQIKDIGLDIVHTQDEFSLGLFGKIIARKYNIPFIHTYHTMWEDYLHYIIPVKGGRHIYTKRFARTLSRNFAIKAECIIAPSQKTEKYLRYRCKIKNKPIYVIPTGIDIEPFKRSNFSEEQKNELKKSLGIQPNDNVILFIGRVAEEKSIDLILNCMPDVFKTLPNSKFLIVGDGPSMNDLKELSQKLNIQDKVIFAGKQPWENIGLYYNLGDVFVNASMTETQGLTFIEAMASGVPIVARYAPNLSEFISNNENGIFIRYQSQMSKSIINVLTDKKLKEKLIKNAYQTAEEHSSKEFGDKLEALYKYIIEEYKLKKDGVPDKNLAKKFMNYIKKYNIKKQPKI